MGKKILFFSMALVTLLAIVYLFIPRKDSKQNKSIISLELSIIESVMLDNPNIVDSLLTTIDTTAVTDLERARISLIEGYNYYINSNYSQSIRSLERSESFFYITDDQYYIHLTKLIKAFTLEFLILQDEAAQEYTECEAYFEKTNDYENQFYALIGLLRLSDGLQIQKKPLIEKIDNLPVYNSKPYFKGLEYAALALIEKNDSIENALQENAISIFVKHGRWNNATLSKINLLSLFLKGTRKNKIEQSYTAIINLFEKYPVANIQRLRTANCYGLILMKKGDIENARDTIMGTLKQAKYLNIITEEINCHKLLFTLYKSKKDYENAYKELFQYYSVLNRNNSIMQNARLLALGANYRFSTIEKEKIILKAKVQQFFWISMFVLTALVLVVILYRVRVQKSKMREEFLMKKNQQIEEQLNDLLNNLEQQEEKNTMLISQVKEAQELFANKREINTFLTAIDNKEVATWMEFETWFIQLRPEWVSILEAKAPTLTPTDIQYCMCFYFNLNNAVVSQLCSVGVDAVKSAKRRLREKLELNDAKELYVFLKDIG